MKHRSLLILGCLTVLYSEQMLAQMSAQQGSVPPSAPNARRMADPLLHKRWQYGVVGGYAWQTHSANFLELPTLPIAVPRGSLGTEPTPFTSGTGTGLEAGVVVEIPLSLELSLGLRGLWGGWSAALTAREIHDVALPPPATGTEQITSEFRFQPTWTSVLFAPHVIWAPDAGLGEDAERGINAPLSGFRLMAGARLGWTLSTGLTQSETLIDAGNGGFLPDGTGRERNRSTGIIPNAERFTLDAQVGLGYDIALPLGTSVRSAALVIAPELWYSAGLLNLVQGVDWRMSQFRAGVAIKFVPAVPEEVPSALPLRPELRPDTRPTNVQPVVSVPVAAVKADVRAFSILDDRREVPEMLIRAQEVVSRSVRQLLPYIFFDNENQTTIPRRYVLLNRQQTRRFDLNNPYDGLTLQQGENVYYHLLNIVGKRMQLNPAATLTLVGTSDGISTERWSSEVAQARAEAVREYLTSAWGIAPERLMLQTRDQPEKPAKPLEDALNMQENRRVELRSTEPSILAPLVVEDSTQITLPPLVRFRPRLQGLAADSAVREWRIQVRQDGFVLKELSGTGTLPSVVDWDMNEQHSGAIPYTASPLEYVLYVTDADGNYIRTAPQQFPTRTVRVVPQPLRPNSINANPVRQKSTDRYSLILFDVGNSAAPAAGAQGIQGADTQLSPEHRQILQDVKQRLTPRSVVRVVGFADKYSSGSEENSTRLSLERAQAVAKFLGAPNTDVRAHGQTPLLYDNSVPEGRVYSRTVLITVETPVNW
jgi:outer membrane protein OmpA-like peptidoglycan-associated protein